MRTSHDSIMILHPDGRIAYWSPGAEQMYGWSAQEATGIEASRLLQTRSSVPLDEIRDTLWRDSSWEGEETHIRKDGSPVHVDSRLTLERDARGESQAILVIGNAKPEQAAGGSRQSGIEPAGDIPPGKHVQQFQQTGSGLEEQLELANRQIADILRNVADGFVSFDRRWRYTYVNEAGARMLGTTVEALLGKPLLDAFPGVAQTRFWSEWNRAVAENKVSCFEEFYEPLDRWYDCRCYPSADGLTVFFANTTDRHAVEKALRESEETLRQANDRLELAQRAARAGTWDWDVTTGRLEWSSHLFELFGLDPRATTPSFEIWTSVLHPEDRALAGERIEQSLRDHALLASEYRIVKPDGQTRWINALGQGTYNEQGVPVRMVGICLDITERKGAEQALHDSQADLNHAQSVAQAGSWRLDVRRNELIWSAENHRIFGIPEGTPLTYETFLEVVHPEDRAYVDREWKAALQGASYDIEHRIVAGGVEKWVRERAVLEFDAEGTLRGGFGTTQDVTERKRMEESLAWLASFPQLNPSPVIEVDLAGHVHYCNPASEKLFPDLRQLETGHPWLADWETVAGALTGDHSSTFEREVRVSGRWYHQAVTFLPETGRIRIYGLEITRRKRVEENLEDAKRLLDSLMEYIPEGITIADAPDTRIRMVSRYGQELLGEPVAGANVEEIVSRWKVFHKDGVTPMALPDLPMLRAVRKGETVRNAELVQFDANGRVLNLSCNAAPIRDGSGAIVGGISAWRDISELKAAENALRASEERFRTLFNSMTEGFALHEILCDEHGTPHDYRFLDVNPSFERLTGIKREDVVGKTVHEILPGENTVWIQNYGIVALTGQPVSFEDFSPVLQRHFQVFAFSPAPRQFAVLFMDITNRKRLEEEMREVERLKLQERSQKEWQSTFDCITDLISIHGWEGTIRRANRAFLEYFALPAETISQRKCFELFHDTLQPAMGCPMDRTRIQGDPHRSEVSDPRTGRTLEISTFPYISDGAPDGCIHVAKDVTGRKRDEMRLIMNNRLAALGQMAAGIAHEINNPLATISGCAEGLLKRLNRGQLDPVIFSDYLRIIGEEILRCKKITTSMLSFARKPDPNRQTIDLHEILDRTLELIGFQGRLQRVNLVKVYHPEALPVLAVEAELKQVFAALLTNALDAVQEQGTLEIVTGTAGDKVWAQIKDSGPGIPSEIIAQIFDPFFSTKQATGGTGLGLSIARKIVQSMDGALEVESAPERGAMFTLSLPGAAAGRAEG